ncbi:MAG: hypothetical protein AB1938_25180, partial [Myxococcota bacterium]
LHRAAEGDAALELRGDEDLPPTGDRVRDVVRLGGDSAAWLERAIGVAFLVTAVFWFLFAQAPWLFLAAVLLALAHTGVSTQWVFSSSLITLQVEDRLRGRVFAVDFMAFTLVLGASSWLGGRLLDRHGFAPRELMSWLAGVLLLSGLVWWGLAPKREATTA